MSLLRVAWLLALPAVWILLDAWPALAQPRQEGFAVNRFDPSEAASDWFTAESLDLRGAWRWAAGLQLEWSHKPLVLYDAEGNEVTSLVRHQLFTHLGGGVVLGHRFRGGLSLPVAVFQDGDPGATPAASFEPSNASTLGNLRLGVDIGLWGDYGDPVVLGAGLHIHLPTGSREAYTGDGSMRAVPRFLLAGRVAWFEYAARIGFNMRTRRTDFGDSDLGSELSFGAAAGARLADERLLVGPEIFGSTAVSGGDGFFGRNTTPLEVLLGAHYSVHPDWRAGVALGTGLTRGFGAPSVRAAASLAWTPSPSAPTPADRDQDGILDANDACPDLPGKPSADPMKTGCPWPEPRDRDGDRVPDREDACPEQPGVTTDNPETNGCPPPSDRDGDGVADQEDACPEQPGVATDNPETNGCPPHPDRDGDGIIDAEDACPDVVGQASENPEQNGCPKAVVKKRQIKILESVNFATASHEIDPSSYAVLDAVAQVLQEHAEIVRLSVQGHTDSRGTRKYNRELSANRAGAVVDYLVRKGVERSRLTAKGFGSERPVASNKTARGRAENRRVEFHILQAMREAAGGDDGQ